MDSRTENNIDVVKMYNYRILPRMCVQSQNRWYSLINWAGMVNTRKFLCICALTAYTLVVCLILDNQIKLMVNNWNPAVNQNQTCCVRINKFQNYTALIGKNQV